MTLGLFCVG